MISNHPRYDRLIFALGDEDLEKFVREWALMDYAEVERFTGPGDIRVGGSTEVEVKEKKDRVDDAMHATKAAVEEGIVPGGGVALLRAKAAIGKLSGDNGDIQAGINIVLKALQAPIRQIAENAGVEGSIVVGKVLAEKSQTYGFDAQTEQYVDMLEAGIVDPASRHRGVSQNWDFQIASRQIQFS